MNWDMALFRPWTIPTLPHLWSIAVEEQFYLLAPFMYRLLRSPRCVAFCAAVLVLTNFGRAISILFVDSQAGNGGLYYMSFTYADVFLAGAIVAKLFTAVAERCCCYPWPAALVWAVVLIGLCRLLAA